MKEKEGLKVCCPPVALAMPRTVLCLSKNYKLQLMRTWKKVGIKKAVDCLSLEINAYRLVQEMVATSSFKFVEL